jgi:hypothetical protein
MQGYIKLSFNSDKSLNSLNKHKLSLPYQNKFTNYLNLLHKPCKTLMSSQKVKLIQLFCQEAMPVKCNLTIITKYQTLFHQNL